MIDGWSPISSTVQYSGVRVVVCRDSFRRSDQSEVTYECVDSADGVRVVARAPPPGAPRICRVRPGAARPAKDEPAHYHLDTGYAFATAAAEVGCIQESEVTGAAWYPLEQAERKAGPGRPARGRFRSPRRAFAWRLRAAWYRPLRDAHLAAK